MWGHDYPHPEGLWPKTAEFLRNSRITLDTTGVRNLSVGSRLLWGQLIDD